MAEIARLGGCSDCMELDFVEREATPEPLMKLGIRLHLAGLSLSNTVSELERFGVDRARSTVHNWVQKAELQPEEGQQPDHVAVDETMIQIDDQRYWLYAAVDIDTNEFLHVKLGTAQNTGLSSLFFSELKQKPMSPTPCFLSMERRGFSKHSVAMDLLFVMKRTDNEIRLNVSIKRLNDELTNLQITSATSIQ